MPAPAGQFGTLSVQRSSTVDRVVSELRRALFEGEIEPGTPLRELALADALGVARSTVREALAALVADGLATREAGRGVSVATVEPESVRDVYRARVVLETAGVRRWPQASEAARERVRAAVDRFAALAGAQTGAQTAQTPARTGARTRAQTAARTGGKAPGVPAADLTAAHLAVHRSFVALTESDRLTAQADALLAEVRLALARVDRVRGDLPDQVASHRHLLDLLEAGQTERAAQELAHHLEGGAASMLETVTG